MPASINIGATLFWVIFFITGFIPVFFIPKKGVIPMFYKIDDDHIVNLNEITYVRFKKNYKDEYEVSTYLKYMSSPITISYDNKHEAIKAYEGLLNQLI
jgi:hypothetical protein